MAKARYAKHPLVHAPKGLIEAIRLGRDGRWRTYDGPAVAFVGRMQGEHDTNGTIVIANCKCAFTDDCPLAKALQKAAETYDTTSIIRRPGLKP